jgi:hypothetical protein
LAVDVGGLLAEEILEVCEVNFSLDVDLKDQVDGVVAQLLLVLDEGVVVDLHELQLSALGA